MKKENFSAENLIHGALEILWNLKWNWSNYVRSIFEKTCEYVKIIVSLNVWRISAVLRIKFQKSYSESVNLFGAEDNVLGFK